MSDMKRVVIIGGGTFSHVRSHLALAAPAFGTTAKQLAALSHKRFDKMVIDLHLTKMADPSSTLVTNDDVALLVDKLIYSNTTKVVFFNAAMCDFRGQVNSMRSGKHVKRLKSRGETHCMELIAEVKIIKRIREQRKDIFLVGFKTTCGASPEAQFEAGLRLLKQSSCNLVMCNDVETRTNFIVTPEEGVYMLGEERGEVLKELVEMAYLRSHLSFTRSTVVSGDPVVWGHPMMPKALVRVVAHCIQEGAYKKFGGVTTGHFAAKIGPRHFLTSIRKTDFNKILDVGMVEVRTDGDDNVISFGAKPSVGGQSQRAIFDAFPKLNCIVHFHCPMKFDANINIPERSQREFECGSHECGHNTRDGLVEVEDGIWCVMLKEHGPNIVFNGDIDPQRVVDFISENFDLHETTAGFQAVYED